MKQPPIKKFPSGVPPQTKPISQRFLRSALSLNKTEAVPTEKLKPAQSRGSAIRAGNVSVPKAKWTNATNFKG